MFRVFDADGSGRMDVGELASFLHRCGHGDVDAAACLREAAGARAGVAEAITFEEFERWATAHPDYIKVFARKLDMIGE